MSHAAPEMATKKPGPAGRPPEVIGPKIQKGVVLAADIYEFLYDEARKQRKAPAALMRDILNRWVEEHRAEPDDEPPAKPRRPRKS